MCHLDMSFMVAFSSSFRTEKASFVDQHMLNKQTICHRSTFLIISAALAQSSFTALFFGLSIFIT
jgi:hypothetical protein